MIETDQLSVENIATLLANMCVSNRLLYDTIVATMKRIANIEKVALYARVSTKGGRQETENQLIALRDYCGKQGWEISGEYTDHETGGTSKRLHFQRLFADARARKFDLVLFWSLDRLSREGVLVTLNHLERLTAAGVEWRSFTEQYLDSTGLFRDAVIAILAVIAKQERVRRSERASAAIARLRRHGKTEHLGRPRKVVDRGQARRLHAQGVPLRAIADELGVSAMTVQRIVKAA
jgi:DNA invertase Pin-like site-specific DNA recombinase